MQFTAYNSNETITINAIFDYRVDESKTVRTMIRIDKKGKLMIE